MKKRILTEEEKKLLLEMETIIARARPDSPGAREIFGHTPIKSVQYTPKPKNDKKLYFIECGEYIKIGISDNIPARIKSLQTSSTSKLVLIKEIPGSRQLESELHRRFAHLHHMGEWFISCPELLKFIKEA